MRMRLLCSAALAIVVLALPAAGLDSYSCYKAKDLKDPKFEKTVIPSLIDQFGTELNAEAKKPFVICNPTKVDGAAIDNAVDHLACYKLKSAGLPAPVQVEVTNAFGTSRLELEKASLFCSRSAKTILPSVTSGSFLALTYNVAGLPEGLSGSHPAVNTPIIGPLLNAYDLVVMQETWKTPDPNPLAPLRVYHEILEAASTHPYKSVSGINPFGTDPERPSALVADGLNQFAIFRFEDTDRQRWTNCHESAADCLSLKGFSFARTTLTPGVDVDVYDLHMEAGGDPEDDALRDAAVTQLGTYINTHSVGRAVIVGGDFNLHTDSEPDSSQFQRLLSEAGLSDVCATLSCPEPGRIDKFLFRSSADITITPATWHFEAETFVDGNGDPLSDHEPLAVRFNWSTTIGVTP